MVSTTTKLANRSLSPKTHSRVDYAALAKEIKKDPMSLRLLKHLRGYRRGTDTVLAERRQDRPNPSTDYCHLRRDFNKPAGDTADNVTIEHIRSFFALLERAGCGEFVKPKVKNTTNLGKFRWKTSPKEVIIALYETASTGKVPSLDWVQAIIEQPAKRSLLHRPRRGKVHAAESIYAVAAQKVEQTLGATSATASTPSLLTGQPVVTVQIRGMLFELDLSKVPADLLKFKRMM
jgi:hypothetical protein